MSMFIYISSLLVLHVLGENREPACSRFHYEEQLLEKMIRMEIKFEALLGDIKKIKTSVKNDLHAIKDEREDEKLEIEKLKDEHIAAMKGLASRMTEFSSNQEQKLARLLTDLVELRNQTAHSKDDAKTQTIAFESHKVTSRGPANGDTIKFSDTILNLGGGYNNENGHFVAPKDGVYLLMVQLCLENSNYIQIDLMVNGNVQTAGQASAYHFHFCYSKQAVLDLKYGDNVWIECANRQDSSTFKESRNHVNSFSGVLIG